ncbi:MAG: hypothetical protein JNJ64_08100 [Flavobacteriales bacterium]|nr:hypothetical protein [Flavobacteriales bacterium]
MRHPRLLPTKPSLAHPRIAATLLIMALGAGGAAHAQLSYNTNILPLGDKEALPGNTGTGCGYHRH